MFKLEADSRLSVAGLFRNIIQNNPTLIHLNLDSFSRNIDSNESVGEIILEALLNSSISTIQYLNLNSNRSWFGNYDTDREGAVEMLTEVISNMTSSLQILNLKWNIFSSVSFEKLVTKIAECGVCSTL